MKKTPLDRALALYRTQSALADALGVRQSNVEYWKKHGLPKWREASVEAAILTYQGDEI